MSILEPGSSFLANISIVVIVVFVLNKWKYIFSNTISKKTDNYFLFWLLITLFSLFYYNKFGKKCQGNEGFFVFCLDKPPELWYNTSVQRHIEAVIMGERSREDTVCL